MNLKTLSAMAFCLILSAQALSLSASEQQADEYLLEATQQEASGSYRKAAKNFMAAHLESDDPVVRMNALYGAARSYRKQGQYGAEFECLNRLLEDHLGQVNFTEIIDRQYEIADSFFNGHRDAAVYWLPWIPDEDRTMEFYEIALKNAPCANESGVQRLRLARIYLEKENPEKAISLLKDILTLNPGTEYARDALLDLADTYCILAQYGDGDGAWAAKCIEILDQFAKDYPDDPEMSWVRKTRMKIDEIILERLYGCAVYNHRIGRDDTARTYLVEIIHNYGDREEAKKAEELLSQIDRSYTPPPENYPRKPAEKFPYERSQIPTENSPIMIVPENSGGKWLLPVRDLKSDVRIDSSKKIPERTFSDDEI